MDDGASGENEETSNEEAGQSTRRGVDFMAPHRPRHAGSAKQTESKTRDLLGWMKEIGRQVPVHYQEPFRRGFSAGWEPTAEDFAADLRQVRAGGAAGWCFHNGDQRGRPDGRPRRSFDLRDRRLFEQLDDEERTFIDRQASVTAGASWGLMLEKVNQHYPFSFRGAADDPLVYAVVRKLTSP